VNPKYNPADNASAYCIEVPPTTIAPLTSTTTQPTTLSTSTTKAPETTVKPSEKSTTSSTTVAPQKPTAAPAPKVVTTEKPDNVDVKPAPEPPHKGIFGSIIIPVMVVLALIGVIFVARKYNMVDRTRNYIRNRGGQQHQVNLIKGNI
jgi:hypothetical protein